MTRQLVQAGAADRELPYWVADDFLRAVALTLLGWAWSRIERALAQQAAPRWSLPAQALRQWIMPEYAMRAGIISARLAHARAALPRAA